MLEPNPLQSRWTSALDEPALRNVIEESTELQEGPFDLTWKLSGGGIVGRVLDLPASDRPFAGRRTPFGYELARIPESGHRHAFEPIAEVHLEPGGEVELLLRLHRSHLSFALPFALMGAACCGSAALAALQRPGTAAMGAVVGLAFLVLPPMRSRVLFREASEKTLVRLREHLQLVGGPGADAG